MGDDIGSGSGTGCRLWSLGDHRQETEMYYVGCAKTKKRNPNRFHHPIINQLNTNHLIDMNGHMILVQY